MNPLIEFFIVHAHQEGALARIYSRISVWLHGHVHYYFLAVFGGLFCQFRRIPTKGEEGEGNGSLQVYQFPRPSFVRAHVIDDYGNPRSNFLFGYGRVENKVMGHEITELNFYSPGFRGIIDESKANIPIPLGQIPFHFRLDLRKGDLLWKLKLDRGGFPRKLSAFSWKGVSRNDVLF